MSDRRPRRIDWYFDFVSPFAWLQAERLARLPAGVELVCKPVLFAGLLDHWGQLGPAEIEPKRAFTYRYVVWRATRLGLTVKVPPVHPFNPLGLLRLAIVLGAGQAAVLRLFRFVWSEGRHPGDPQSWSALLAELGVPDAESRIVHPAVKEQLRRNGEEAVARGAFGVPSAFVDDRLFWGEDATDMLLDYLAGDPLFAAAEMQRADTLPLGKMRRRLGRESRPNPADD